MRIALISDIHGNGVALDAVLADAGEVVAHWFLGDLVAHGPRPVECVRRVRALPGLVAVRGKTDTRSRNLRPRGRVADLAGSDHPSADWLVGKLTTPWG